MKRDYERSYHDELKHHLRHACERVARSCYHGPNEEAVTILTAVMEKAAIDAMLNQLSVVPRVKDLIAKTKEPPNAN